MTRLAMLASAAVFALSACQKGQEQSQASDSTARNLTLAPSESSATMRDVPDQNQKTTLPPVTRPPAQRNPTRRTNPPSPPARARLGVGTQMDIAATDTISSRTAKVGDPFTAHVVEDVRNAAGKARCPPRPGANGPNSDVKPAPKPSTPGA